MGEEKKGVKAPAKSRKLKYYGLSSPVFHTATTVFCYIVLSSAFCKCQGFAFAIILIYVFQ